LPSRRSAFAWLVRKEGRQLLASRAWWVLATLTGPLVGLTFTSAVNAFSEVSAGAGRGCGAVCAPLVGIWAPTASAFELAAIFLLPFVAIGLTAGDRQSGALRLELQRPLSPVVRMTAKVMALAAGWIIIGAAGAIAVALWKSYGGHAYWPELIVVVIGQMLNAAATIGLATMIAAMTDHPSTAAIVALAITIGTWVIDFGAALYGGLWSLLAQYTPAAIVAQFNHGLLSVSTVLIILTVTATTVAIAAIWIQIGEPTRRRWARSAAVLAASVLACGALRLVPGYVDASESRQNSFSEPEQEALERLATPVSIDVHLSPQDARRMQFDRGALPKLKRALPHLTVRYLSRTSTGLYEQTDPGYGEIVYSIGGRQSSTRVVTDEGALETIFDLAGIAPPSEIDAPYMGHPFVGRAAYAGIIFYVLWPALVGAAGFVVPRRLA
jgi:ABC-2 type transport system permease protein